MDGAWNMKREVQKHQDSFGLNAVDCLLTHGQVKKAVRHRDAISHDQSEFVKGIGLRVSLARESMSPGASPAPQTKRCVAIFMDWEPDSPSAKWNAFWHVTLESFAIRSAGGHSARRDLRSSPAVSL